jgi:hypothetical protein
MGIRARIELATSGFARQRSFPLSYRIMAIMLLSNQVSLRDDERQRTKEEG